MILYLGTYPLPESDLIFRNGGSIMINNNSIIHNVKTKRQIKYKATTTQVHCIKVNNLIQLARIKTLSPYSSNIKLL